jgi:hypothetical protein
MARSGLTVAVPREKMDISGRYLLKTSIRKSVRVSDSGTRRPLYRFVLRSRCCQEIPCKDFIAADY